MRDDLLSALRALKPAPAATIGAILTLAVAIGMNVGMVGLVSRALLSLPEHVVDPEGLVGLAFERGEGDERVRMSSTSYVTYTTVRDDVEGFSGVAAWQRSPGTVSIEGDQVQVKTMLVSGNYFEVLGATARIGRPVQAADDVAAAEPVAVVAHEFWRASFGGGDILGRRIIVNGLDYVVTGVMPRGFSGHSAASVDVWVPFSAAMRRLPGWDRDPYRRVTSILARLRPGTTTVAASSQAGTATGLRVVFDPLGGANVPAVDRRVAYWLTGVSSLVFVIGIANAATLLLVRAARRRRDFAIRAALGATRARLWRQAGFEALVISGLATGASLLLASWFDGAVRQVLLPDVAPASGAAPLPLAAAAIAGVIAAVATCLANAANLPGGLTAGALDGAERHSGRRPLAQTSLLVIQTALSVVLLAGAGLFGRSLYNLLSQDFGINMNGVVVVDVEQGPGGARGPAFEDSIDAVRAIPGVRAATPIAAIPFSGFHVPPIAIPGRAEPPSVGGQLPFLQAATPEFFDILGVRIVEGRKFTAGDDRGAPVVIVNETMARAVWPGESAVGKCIRIGFDPDFDPETATGPPTPSAALPCREIVGVAHDMRQRSLVPTENEARLMQYFVPFSHVPVPPFIPDPDPSAWGLLLKVDTDVAAVAPAVRRAIVGNRTDLPYVRVRPYTQLLDRQMRPWRLGTMLLGLFSALAVSVAAVGLYAAFAHAVAIRRREMAIRLALGARPRRVIRLVVREAVVLATVGIAAGWLTAVLGGKWLQALLYDTSSTDPAVLGGAGLLMLLVVVAATLMPARAASRSDPATLLREGV